MASRVEGDVLITADMRIPRKMPPIHDWLTEQCISIGLVPAIEPVNPFTSG